MPVGDQHPKHYIPRVSTFIYVEIKRNTFRLTYFGQFNIFHQDEINIVKQSKRELKMKIIRLLVLMSQIIMNEQVKIYLDKEWI